MFEFPEQMPRKQRSRGPQEHPGGPLETVDDAWKTDLREEMTTRGLTQKDLALKIDASEGTISGMFRAGPRQIRAVFKRRIEDLVGWTGRGANRELLERIARRGAKLDSQALQQVANLIDLLADKR